MFIDKTCRQEIREEAMSHNDKQKPEPGFLEKYQKKGEI